jgi:protein-tyrosine phosphatase
MLQVAAANGTTDLVATPHANSEFPFDSARNADLLAQLREQAPAGLSLHSGCDFHLAYENIRAALEDPAPFTINAGRWLLVEFSDIVVASNTEHILAQLRDAGLRLILTHPERNRPLRQDIDRLERMVNDGHFLQVTALSLTGGFGSSAKQASHELLRRGLVHFIASDAHDPTHRAPRLDLARTLLARDFSPSLAMRLTEDNPRAVITNAELPPGPLAPVASRPWWRFWS